MRNQKSKKAKSFESAVASSSSDIRTKVQELDIHLGSLGLYKTNLRSTTLSDEETRVPFGVILGFVRPMGDPSNDKAYSSVANIYYGSVLSSLTVESSADSWRKDHITAYFNSLADLHWMRYFMGNLLALSRMSTLQSSPAMNSFVTNAMNGQIRPNYNQLSDMLSRIPYPQELVDIFDKSFPITTMSSDPTSDIRMWIPKWLEPAMGAGLTGDTINALVLNMIDAFTTNTLMTRLSRVCTVGYPRMPEITLENGIQFSNASVNNILNVPFYDGTISQPFAADGVEFPIFYYDKVTVDGLMTIGTDDSVTTDVPSALVWYPKVVQADSNITLCVLDDQGFFIDAFTDGNAFLKFGPVWEGTALVEPATNAFINTTFSTYNSVSRVLGAYVVGRLPLPAPTLYS